MSGEQKSCDLITELAIAHPAAIFGILDPHEQTEEIVTFCLSTVVNHGVNRFIELGDRILVVAINLLAMILLSRLGASVGYSPP